ncbi:MAG: TonB-dependent siderophore receptor [Ferrovibrio sp.]|uniref:TonB-dependent siderophore receptor n=1 Tax=Ferrovibrio sp. TaxID=1917215 RepID=UPI002619FFD8|nr:TonB-dependent siderophore receptor [Ferrovibrio sp.]MCW0233066.1 TonB-dependent siderophore receptor [Ferrovibrio sp.]
MAARRLLLSTARFALFFLAAPALAQTATDNPPPAQLPALQVEGQRPAEQADGPVEGYRATRSATGTKTDTPLKEVPQAVNVIPRQAIEDQQANRLVDVLLNVPNVQPGSTIGNRAENFTIRGFRSETYARDGVVNNPLFTSETFLDLSNVERVEVLKGPASVLFGQGDPGGLINIVTRKPQSAPAVGGSLEIGSYDFRRAEADATSALDDGKTLAARITAAYQESDSFRDFFTDSERKTVSPVFLWTPNDRSRLTFGLDYTDQTQPFDRGLVAIGTRVAPLPTSRYLGERFSVFESEKTMLQYRFEHDVNDWLTLRQITRLDRGDSYRYSADPQAVNATTGVLTRRARIQNDDTRYGDIILDATARFDTGPVAHTLLMGGEYSKAVRDLDWRLYNLGSINIYNPVYGATPGSFISATAQTHDVDMYAAYLQDQIALTEQVKLIVGGRFDSFSQVDTQTTATTNTRTAQSDSAFSPRAGIVYQPVQPLALYASYTESFKPQTATDSSGQALAAETGQQYEVGAKLDIIPDRLSTTLAVFNLTRQNVATEDPANDDFSVATGEQRSRGVELDVTGTILPGWQVMLGGAYLNTKVTKDSLYQGNSLAGAPRWSGSLWSTYQFLSGPLRGFGFGGGLIAVDDRVGEIGNTFAVPGYARVDATVFYDLNERIRLSLAAKNLFDADYIETPVGRTEIYAGAPLTVLARISAKY